MKTSQSGFSLHEIIGALAIGSLMLLGLGAMMGDSMEDMTDQQTALYQRQIADAAAKYIKDDYTVLLSAASSGVPIARDFSKLAPFLPSGFANQNPYGQTPCVLLLKNGTANLDALIVTEGKPLLANPADPKSKERKDLPYIAVNAGQGAGYISGDGTSSTPTQANGAFGSWLMPAARLSTFLSKNCSGKSAGIGNLATTYFYQGPGQFTTDFLYKVEVPGRPDLNRMDAPLQLASTAYPQALENQSDTKCVAGDTSTYGRIAVDAQNALLSCRNGVWKRQGLGSPVASYAALPIAGNIVGDVRMVTDAAWTRAFTWNGASWVALAVDQNGRITTDDMLLNKVVTKGLACNPNGIVARDTEGLLLSCQTGKWATQSTVELGSSYRDCRQIRPSKYAVSEPTCPTKFLPQSAVTFDAAADTWSATIVQTVSVLKNGLISASVYTQMNRGLVSNPGGANGQAALVVTITDKDTGIVLGSSQAQTSALHDDSAGINVSLSKAVPKNTNGYDITILTMYSLFDDGADTKFNESNYSANGTTVQQTPLMTGWNLDIFY